MSGAAAAERRAGGEAVPSVLLGLDGVAKRYQDGTEALSGLDLEVAAQEFVAVLGPSGCGKSTVLRLVAGLLEPSAGAIRWPAGRREVGFVFQEPNLMPWASVFQNVWLPLRLHGRSRVQATPEVSAALALVGLGDWAEAMPHQLSGGMRMRVSIARALVTRPGLMLLDEPFAALDELTRTKLDQELLRLWARERWTVLFVTHSVFEAVFLATRIVVMRNRPGAVAADIAVDLPFPRVPELRLDPAYQRLCLQVSAELQRVAGSDG